jgi:hypothetical protein
MPSNKVLWADAVALSLEEGVWGDCLAAGLEVAVRELHG